MLVFAETAKPTLCEVAVPGYLCVRVTPDRYCLLVVGPVLICLVASLFTVN